MGEQTTAEEARAVLQAERQERVQACQAAIQAALAEHGCVLDVMVVLREGQVRPQVRVLAKKE